MPGPIIQLLPDLAATACLAGHLARLVRPGDALLLQGPLGAGKTAFARAFLRALTGDPGLEVPSPSFTLVQSYDLPSGAEAHHYDLYRLSGPADLAELGWDAAQQGILLVEWPERLGHLRPPGALVLTLEHTAAEEARIARLDGWPDRLAGLPA